MIDKILPTLAVVAVTFAMVHGDMPRDIGLALLIIMLLGRILQEVRRKR